MFETLIVFQWRGILLYQFTKVVETYHSRVFSAFGTAYRQMIKVSFLRTLHIYTNRLKENVSDEKHAT